MDTGGNGLAESVQMQVHYAGIGFGHDDCSAYRPSWAGGSEEIGPVLALIARRTRPGSAFRPNARQGGRSLLHPGTRFRGTCHGPLSPLASFRNGECQRLVLAMNCRKQFLDRHVLTFDELNEHHVHVVKQQLAYTAGINLAAR